MAAVLADPNPKFSIEEVRSFYATQFPELTNAAITSPDNIGERLRYNFERAIGSKADSDPQREAITPDRNP